MQLRKILSILLTMVLLCSSAAILAPIAVAAPDDTAIPSADLSLTLPAVGGSGSDPAAVSITGGEHFTLGDAYWFKGEGEGIGSAPSSFEAGTAYFAEIYLIADEGCIFTDDTAVTIAETSVKNTAVENSGKKLYIRTENVTPAASADTAIPSADLSLTLPAVGGSGSDPAAVSITGGEHFTLGDAYWFKGEGEGIGSAPSSFEAGTAYFAEIYLIADEGYIFTDDTAVTIAEAPVKNTAVENSGKKLYIRTENVTPAAPADTAIPSVDLSLTLPAVGGSGSDPAAVSITGGEHFTLGDAYWFKGEGEGIGSAPSSFEAGTAYFAEIYLIADEGYIFTDDTAVTIAEAPVKNTAVENSGKKLYIRTENVTLAASAATYTATCELPSAAAGEVTIASTDFAAGDTVQLIINAETGYELDTLSVVDENGNTIPVSSDNSFIMPASNVTVTATFKESSAVPSDGADFTVAFETANDDAAPASQTVESGKTLTKPADPAKTGWDFAGWYQDEACTVPFDFSTPITANITLYAKWTEAKQDSYSVVSTGGSTWTRGSNDTVTITVKRSEADDTCFSHFIGVQLDGTALSADEFEAKAGSTVVTLYAATLEKLSDGTHTITVNFDDGKAETTLTIQAAASPNDSKAPKTGDSSRTGFWLVMMVLSAIGFCSLVILSRIPCRTSKRTK